MTNLVNTVDRFAELHAQINALTEEANALKAELIASGESTIKGTFVKASVSVSAPRVTVDWRSVSEQLNPPEELVKACTKVGNPVASVRLYGL